MKLSVTRSLISAALNGELDHVGFATHEVFSVEYPTSCPGVPDGLLDPRNTWRDKDAYDKTANMLAESFVRNFQRYAEFASPEIMAGAPRIAAGHAD
jgi:phosphoenolpyruvate carboxykinase (ATP)